jgi:hypothetical protein
VAKIWVKGKIVLLAIYIKKKILRQKKKKNYGNSNIYFTMKKKILIFKKNSIKETKNPSRYYKLYYN